MKLGPQENRKHHWHKWHCQSLGARGAFAASQRLKLGSSLGSTWVLQRSFIGLYFLFCLCLGEGRLLFGQQWSPNRPVAFYADQDFVSGTSRLGSSGAEDPAAWMANEGGDLDVDFSRQFIDGHFVYDDAGLPFSDGSHGATSYEGDWLDDSYGAYDPMFPNRPYLVPRIADRFRQRPLFPNRPYLRGSWPGGPPLEQPRAFWLNPFAIQQGLGNFLFRGNHPADTGSLGFPFSTIPSHMVDRVPRPYFGHGQSYVGPRHIDRGQPLMGTSWTNRPFYIDGYTGALLAWNLTDDLKQKHGTLSGVRLGWDFEHFWGAQFGLGFGSTKTSPDGADVSIRMADLAVLYYPWGDARWRPYTGLGLGVGRYAFLDSNQASINEFAVQIPLSIGVKYAFKPWWALRLDATNYLVMPASELRFMNNVALNMAVEVRFGGQRRSYFPYSPSIQLR